MGHPPAHNVIFGGPRYPRSALPARVVELGEVGGEAADPRLLELSGVAAVAMSAASVVGGTLAAALAAERGPEAR